MNGINCGKRITKTGAGRSSNVGLGLEFMFSPSKRILVLRHTAVHSLQSISRDPGSLLGGSTSPVNTI